MPEKKEEKINDATVDKKTENTEEKVEAKAEVEKKAEAKPKTVKKAEAKPKAEKKAKAKPEEEKKAETKAPEPEKKEEKAEAKASPPAAPKAKAKKKAPKKEKVKKLGLIGNLNTLAELRTDIPEINSGDTVRVMYRVIEGGKERAQAFEGVVIAQKNSGITQTVTVRKTSFGIAVERIFPLNSKLVQKIEVKKHAKVRRAKLYYLRNLKGKAARLKELRK